MAGAVGQVGGSAVADDEKKMAQDAKDTIDLLDTYPKLASGMADKVQGYFKDRKVGFKQIKSDIAGFAKDADGCDKKVAAAEKLNKDVQKSGLDAKLKKTLADTIKDAKSALTSLRTNLDQYAAYADKAESEDGDIAKDLAACVKQLKDSAEFLGGAAITLPGEAETLDGIDKKTKNPAEKVKALSPVLKQLTQRVKEVGAQITTGESAVDSAKSVLKRRKSAVFLPSTDALCDDADTLATTVAAKAKACRGLNDKLLDRVNFFAKYVKQLGG